jgi:hypothetical protein
MQPPAGSVPIADDGDAFRFCSTCAFSAACLEQGFDKSRLEELHVLVAHVGPFEEGVHIFREGDPFEAIAAVRLGTVKTYVTDSEGREQVQGFFLPGEVIGLNAISQARYPCNAVALVAARLHLRLRRRPAEQNPVHLSDPVLVSQLRSHPRGQPLGVLLHEVAVHEGQPLQRHVRHEALLG